MYELQETYIKRRLTFHAHALVGEATRCDAGSAVFAGIRRARNVHVIANLTRPLERTVTPAQT